MKKKTTKRENNKKYKGGLNSLTWNSIATKRYKNTYKIVQNQQVQTDDTKFRHSFVVYESSSTVSKFAHIVTSHGYFRLLGTGSELRLFRTFGWASRDILPLATELLPLAVLLSDSELPPNCLPFFSKGEAPKAMVDRDGVIDFLPVDGVLGDFPMLEVVKVGRAMVVCRCLGVCCCGDGVARLVRFRLNGVIDWVLPEGRTIFSYIS